MKRKRKIVLLLVVMLLSFVFVCVEAKPAAIVSSTVYTTADQTEVKMYVVVNTFFRIDQEKMTEEIISEYWKINGRRENESYTLVLYRTKLHFRINKEYAAIEDNK